MTNGNKTIVSEGWHKIRNGSGIFADEYLLNNSLSLRAYFVWNSRVNALQFMELKNKKY